LGGGGQFRQTFEPNNFEAKNNFRKQQALSTGQNNLRKFILFLHKSSLAKKLKPQRANGLHFGGRGAIFLFGGA